MPKSHSVVLPLSAEQRIALISEVYAAVFDGSETFVEDNIGADLAYLLGAVSAGGSVDWSHGGADQRPTLCAVLTQAFAPAHSIWNFIVL